VYDSVYTESINGVYFNRAIAVVNLTFIVYPMSPISQKPTQNFKTEDGAGDPRRR
jgi:hypothetical protein